VRYEVLTAVNIRILNVYLDVNSFKRVRGLERNRSGKYASPISLMLRVVVGM
jgi:hypothetical protein